MRILSTSSYCPITFTRNKFNKTVQKLIIQPYSNHCGNSNHYGIEKSFIRKDSYMQPGAKSQEIDGVELTNCSWAQIYWQRHILNVINYLYLTAKSSWISDQPENSVMYFAYKSDTRMTRTDQSSVFNSHFFNRSQVTLLSEFIIKIWFHQNDESCFGVLARHHHDDEQVLRLYAVQWNLA